MWWRGLFPAQFMWHGSRISVLPFTEGITRREAVQTISVCAAAAATFLTRIKWFMGWRRFGAVRGRVGVAGMWRNVLGMGQKFKMRLAWVTEAGSKAGPICITVWIWAIITYCDGLYFPWILKRVMRFIACSSWLTSLYSRVVWPSLREHVHSDAHHVGVLPISRRDTWTIFNMST